MYVYIYIYILYAHVCMYVCVYIYIYIYIYSSWQFSARPGAPADSAAGEGERKIWDQDLPRFARKRKGFGESEFFVLPTERL